MYKILLATDGSSGAAKALEETIKIAGPLNAEVTVISVISQTVDVRDYAGVSYEKLDLFLKDYNEIIEKKTQELVKSAEKPLKEKGIKVETKVLAGNPADVITRIAKEGNFDLIVVGSRGLSKAKELFLGSVSNKVAHLTDTNVLIVK